MEFQDSEVRTTTLDSGAGLNVWPENLQSHVPMMAQAGHDRGNSHERRQFGGEDRHILPCFHSASVRSCHDGIVGGYAVRPVFAAECDMGEIESDVDGDGSGGDRRTQRLRDPRMPWMLEVEEHELTHLAFGNWFRRCV